MKKLFLAAAALACVVAMPMSANAEGYNRVTLGYNNVHYGFNKDYSEADGVSLNGFGVGYIHGFGFSETPIFLETGVNFNMGFGTYEWKTESGESGEYYYKVTPKDKYMNMNFTVPVNVTYKFSVGDNLTVAPYAGINFKLNLIGKMKEDYDIDTNLPKEYFDPEDYKADWVNLYSSSEKNMGHKDYTWNRFQMGWQVGVGAQYSNYYFGVEYGTDFIPAYSHKFEGGYKPKVSCGTLKVNLGYCF